jgi:hypothetical protein
MHSTDEPYRLFSSVTLGSGEPHDRQCMHISKIMVPKSAAPEVLRIPNLSIAGDNITEVDHSGDSSSAAANEGRQETAPASLSAWVIG